MIEPHEGGGSRHSPAVVKAVSRAAAGGVNRVVERQVGLADARHRRHSGWDGRKAGKKVGGKRPAERERRRRTRARLVAAAYMLLEMMQNGDMVCRALADDIAGRVAATSLAP